MRNPARFQLNESHYAECRSYPSGRMVLVDFWTHLNGNDSIRFAAWMARVAAWCNEKPKAKRGKR